MSDSSSSDALVAASKSICAHMNADHSDAVLAYAKHYAHITTATTAEMTAIDTTAIHLLVTTPTTTNQVIRIPFATPLTSKVQARPVLIDMAKTAFKALGIQQDDQQGHSHSHGEGGGHSHSHDLRGGSNSGGDYRAPMVKSSIAIIIGLILLYLCAFYNPLPFPSLEPIRHFSLFLFRSLSMVRFVWWVTVVVHIGEGLYAVLVCRQLGMNVGVTVVWGGTDDDIGICKFNEVGEAEEEKKW